MKSNPYLLVFALLSILTLQLSFVYSQTSDATFDRIYLKDGQVVQGKVEIVKPDVVVFTDKETGVKYEYKKSDVKLILLSNGKYLSFEDTKPLEQTSKTTPTEKKTNNEPSEQSQQRQTGGEEGQPVASLLLHKYFKVFGGVNIPVGDFSSTTSQYSGFAKTGFTLGGEFDAEVTKSFEVGVTGSLYVNGVDVAEYQNQLAGALGGAPTVDVTSYVYYSALGNVGFDAPVSNSVSLYGKGKLGIVFGSSPEYKATFNNVTADQQSASASAIAYGFSLGAIIENKFDAGFQYLTSEPEADITITSSNGSTLTTKAKQPLSTIALTVGVIF